nr:MAG TPA: hypothetical protein [Caudoviricetes sp.]DAP20645.1 MAG TPA: hypothetical protein [Caudoviricetes sp.]
MYSIPYAKICQSNSNLCCILASSICSCKKYGV